MLSCDYVAGRIVRAVQQNRDVVYMPAALYVLLGCKG